MTPYRDVLGACTLSRGQQKTSHSSMWINHGRTWTPHPSCLARECGRIRAESAKMIGGSMHTALSHTFLWPGPISRKKQRQRHAAVSDADCGPPAPPSTAHDIRQHGALAARERRRTMTASHFRALLEAFTQIQGPSPAQMPTLIRVQGPGFCT